MTWREPGPQSDRDENSESLTETQRLFEEYILRSEEGEEVDFDALCEAHPRRADDLRRLLNLYEQISMEMLGEEPSAGRSGILERFRSLSHPSGPRYSDHREIARGGMGAILEVWDRGLRRSLAMKVVRERPELTEKLGETAQQRDLLRFLDEALITGRLDHPGIVPVHELGLDKDTRPYFTMRLIQGQTLGEVIESLHNGVQGWSLTRTLGVVLKACEAVAYAHSKGVIHRDLKPANIMVGQYGEVYVMDWGLAKVCSPELFDARPTSIEMEEPHADRTSNPAEDSTRPFQTHAGEVFGTPSYMPPEQALGHHRDIGPHSDVYAMGAVLYHLLAGTSPYVHGTTPSSSRAILQRVQEGPPEPVESLAPTMPAELIAICERSMARDVGDRYADMIELAEDLRAYLEQRVVKAYRVGWIAEFMTWVRRNRRLSMALLATLVILVVGSVAITVITQRSNNRLRQSNEVSLARLDDFRRMADARLANELLQEEARLWPRRPERIEAMKRWLESCGHLVERLPGHRETVKRIEREPPPSTEASAQLEHAWQLQVYERLVKDISRLDDLGDDVQERLEFVETIREHTLEEWESDWEDALVEIADHPLYGGLELSPQFGLIPLGPNDDSELWEFLVWETGEAPAINTGLEEDSGIVLVLIPGSEGVAPFFLSKYEMTQSQWSRITGQNPSLYTEELDGGSFAWSPTLPVEQVSFSACQDVLMRVGLTLPTDVQWEHAVRAGTTTRFFFGEQESGLEDVANVYDSSHRRILGDSNPNLAPWDDGYTTTAPVGTFAPNPFGLHDVYGNVAEWCASPFASDESNRSETTPQTIRGGFFGNTHQEANSVQKFGLSPDNSLVEIGVRPSLAIRE